jgi:hypothetical protein
MARQPNDKRNYNPNSKPVSQAKPTASIHQGTPRLEPGSTMADDRVSPWPHKHCSFTLLAASRHIHAISEHTHAEPCTFSVAHAATCASPHTQPHTHAHVRARPRTFTQTRAQTARMPAHTHKHTNMHTYTHGHAHAYTPHPHPHTHTHTHIHTHIYTHSSATQA